MGCASSGHITKLRQSIFAFRYLCVRPFYERAVSDQYPQRSMHRTVYVAHSSFIEGSYMTKNTASVFLHFIHNPGALLIAAMPLAR
jgi:hypothetical protein